MTRRKRPPVPLRVAVVGAGKVGLVLGKILQEEGARISAVVSRTPASVRRGAAFLRCGPCGTSLDVIPSETDLVLIATPHDGVIQTAESLARRSDLNFRRLAICHASGMLTASALSALEAQGAAVFSFHPLQTFPRDFALKAIVPRARGIYFGVDGNPRGLRMAHRLARTLKGRAIEIPPGRRVLYHAACVIASNHLTALLSVLQSVHRAIRPTDASFFVIYRAIIEATLANVAATSPAQALSGPVARGGTATVAAHLEALRKAMPEFLPYYTRMSLETVRLASRKGSLSEAKRDELNALIRSFMNESPSFEEAT
ncbi:MAG TPA: Rossmann-like and DUF2520 domain-containing protein [Bacteroidota bacterium]|nr:Rossmann-like and DUF2520 domain-containing protein [Bacteroidota bacterium]